MKDKRLFTDSLSDERITENRKAKYFKEYGPS